MFVTAEDDGSEARFVRQMATAVVDDILATLQQHRWTRTEGDDFSEQLWLFKTDETPADDAVEHPYHFSSHILLWHTLTSLAMLQALVPDCIKTPVAEWATKVHSATMKNFSTDNPRTGQPMFAYLTSTRGEFQLYHDANDLPSALAPKWGFCDASSERWRNTLDFAFSADNLGFFPDGINAGLGSVHTMDPWPLGDSQELLYAELAGLPEREKTIRNRLARIVQWDGLYPEAIDRHTGATTSKHWFGWPGCFIGTVLLDRASTNLAASAIDGAQIIAQHIRAQLDAHREAYRDSTYLPPLFVGMQGPQGSGKSFLAERTKATLSSAPHNLNVAILSTDDLYLDHDGLVQLANEHPTNKLLQGRGLPGSHDLHLGRRLLKAIKAQGGRRRDVNAASQAACIRLPSFDKGAYNGSGDRRPQGNDEQISGDLDVFVFEGWSQGFLAADEADLEAKHSATREAGYRPYFLDHSIDSLLEVNSLLRDYAKEWYAMMSTFVQVRANSKITERDLRAE
jgi:pantothenate kinase-related protein Tda10